MQTATFTSGTRLGTHPVLVVVLRPPSPVLRPRRVHSYIRPRLGDAPTQDEPRRLVARASRGRPSILYLERRYRYGLANSPDGCVAAISRRRREVTDILATHLPTPHTPGLVAKPTTRFGRKAVVVRADADATNWIKKDPTVLMASAAGWFIPSNIGVGAFGGKSLFGLFTASIGENMAHFPTGPALDDKFWLYMVTWHVGLFVTMTLGQIGFQGRKQGYW